MYRVRSAARLRVINAPARAAIIEALRGRGAMTAAELADAVESTPGAVHHHLGVLRSIGLVADAGVRPSGRRPARLFVLTCDVIEIDPGTSPALAREKSRAGRRVLQRAARDLDAALTARCDDVELRLTRDLVRLSAADLRTLRRRLDDLHAFLRAADGAEHPHHIGLTIAMAPIEPS
ncbi:MAG: helix-turn-helix transcriptional regulator [Phycisphaerales bacterium]|nr:helix-turn-helix transcriptional regulator [Phycisphaerales bacterium]